MGKPGLAAVFGFGPLNCAPTKAALSAGVYSPLTRHLARISHSADWV